MVLVRGMLSLGRFVRISRTFIMLPRIAMHGQGEKEIP
jgi:hypothetical protein